MGADGTREGRQVIKSYEAEVARGAEYLDQKYPGWELAIDLANFDIEHGCRCILGQVVPALNPEYKTKNEDEDDPLSGYDYEFNSVRRQASGQSGQSGQASDKMSDKMSDKASGKLSALHWAREHGFSIEPPHLFTHTSRRLMWLALEETWIALIKTRHDTGALSEL